jgi:ribosomal protein S21
MSKTVIEVKKGTTENNATLLRRFSRKVIDSGIVRHVKSKRYNERKISKVSQKELALRRMNRKKEVEKLKKLGKMKETKNTRRR